MLAGVMVLWFLLTALSVIYVAIDIRTTPEDPVMKWGFVIITAFIGPLGAFLYLLGCREPLPGTHAEYVRVMWRQVLGSTLHCVAGDGLGIAVAAVITSYGHFPLYGDLMAEYVLGFLLGWTVFQALFMRGMVGGSYQRALRTTFIPELYSMNGVMAGMGGLMIVLMSHVPGVHHPWTPQFWFVMSMSLLTGLVVAYPINWWLVSHGLKHGMMTAPTPDRPIPVAAGLALAGAALKRTTAQHPDDSPDHTASTNHPGTHALDTMPMRQGSIVPRWELPRMGVLTFATLLIGIGLGAQFGTLFMQ